MERRWPSGDVLLASLILSGPSRWSTVPYLYAVRCNDLHMLGDFAADVHCEGPSSALIFNLEILHGAPGTLMAWVRSSVVLRRAELFLHSRFLSDHSLFRPFLGLDDAVLDKPRIFGRDRRSTRRAGRRPEQIYFAGEPAHSLAFRHN